jgi:two-component system, cell cycle sensor histidine kinase and response regulator CckA
MSQTVDHASSSMLWNMVAPLRILVIENSPADAELNLLELTRAGFRCEPKIVAMRAEFLELLGRFSFDIVLADYRLSGWTGMDAFAAIRQAGRDVPFILVTGTVGEEVAVECIKQGVTDFVLKEHSKRLPLVVARALEERAVRDGRSFMVEALRQSEANSLFLFAHNPLSMWVVERATLQIFQVNDAALRSYGYARTDFLRMIASELHPEEEAPQFLAAFQAGNSRNPLAGQWHHRRKDRSMIDVEIFLNSMEYAGHPAALIVALDITERRVLEQQLRHAQKFEAIGQLAGGIAHDFNNVIGAIQGWAEMGEDQAASHSPVLEGYFKKIHSQCDRVTALIRKLLAFARRQILESRSLSLNQTAQDVINLLENVIGKDIEIKKDLADDLSSVRADPTQVEQVLMNLCINSRDAMPKGGRITIETRNAAFSEEDCRRIPGLQPGRFAELRVRDTGIGMDAGVREKIFEPFFTTKEAGKGTGLGLATVYGIVKQHSGFVQVESELGRGSTFRVFLPVEVTTSARRSETPIFEDVPVRGGSETILLADDHIGICEMAQSVLTAKGYEVLVAHDGQEAMKIFLAHRDRISLVLLDVIMPKRSGTEVFADITALNPGVIVLFATGYSNEIAALADLVARGVSILRKPYSPAALCRRVREVLDAAAVSSIPA